MLRGSEAFKENGHFLETRLTQKPDLAVRKVDPDAAREVRKAKQEDG